MWTDNVKCFETIAEAQFPGLVSSSHRLCQELQNDRIVVGYKLEHSLSIMDFFEIMSQVESDYRLLFYFAFSSNVAFGRKAAYYSNPVERNLYLFNVTTGPDGDISDIFVSIFDSVDRMYRELEEQMKYIDNLNGAIKNIIPQKLLITDFCFAEK